MNSQVLIDRELLERLAIQRKPDGWLELNTATAFTAAKELREILDATPAPIPDAGEGVEAWFTEDYLTDKSATTYDPVVADRWRTKGWPVTRLVSALQASAMAVPDGWQLVPVEPTELMIRHGDQNYSWSVANIYRAMLAASTAPGYSQ
ncbi:MAG: hypothetical protein K2Y25_07440 [Pseudomonadaceae bacterium]|nr:hypothetical protein [Pseudomonadaceae bacterium]